MIPIVYRFDDGNAPVHVGTAGSLVNLLEKCLVTGYGDKLPAGWTKDYANVENTIAAFRNNPATGTGFFCLVTDTVGITATVQGYESMTAIDVGVGPFHASGLSFSKAPAATPVKWMLIATDTVFYLFTYRGCTTTTELNFFTMVNGTDNSRLQSLMFGDFIPESASTFNCVVGVGSSSERGDSVLSSWYWPHGHMSDAGVAGFWSPRPVSGLVGTPTSVLQIFAGGPLGYYYHAQYGLREYGPDYVQNGELIIAKPALCDGANSTEYRGVLQGLFKACHQALSFKALLDGVGFPVITTNGRSFVVVAHFGVYQGNYSSLTLLFELGVDWTL